MNCRLLLSSDYSNRETRMIIEMQLKCIDLKWGSLFPFPVLLEIP